MYVEQRGGAICCTWGGWGVSCREDAINDGSPSGGQIDVAWWAVVRNKINVDLRPFDWLSDQVRLSEPFLVAVMDCPCKLHMWSKWSVKVFWATSVMSTGKVGGRLMFMTRCWDVWRLCLRGPSVTFCHGFRLRHAAIRSSQCWAPVSRCIPVYQIQHSFRANNTVIARAGTTGILSQYRPVRPPSISESPIVAIAIIITSIL